MPVEQNPALTVSAAKDSSNSCFSIPGKSFFPTGPLWVCKLTQQALPLCLDRLEDCPVEGLKQLGQVAWKTEKNNNMLFGPLSQSKSQVRGMSIKNKNCCLVYHLLCMLEEYLDEPVKKVG